MKCLTLAVVCAFFGAQCCIADTDLSVSSGFSNAFVSPSTSINWVDGPVWLPSVTASNSRDEHRFSATLWAVINLDESIGFDNSSDVNGRGESNSGEITEWDVFLDYTFVGFEFFDLSLGYIRYDFNQLDAYTTDVYVKLLAKTLPLKPSVNILYDLDGGNEGAHVIFGLSRTFELGGFDVDGFASLSWADESYAQAYFSDDISNHSGFSNWSAGLSHTFDYNNFKITPKLEYYNLRNHRGVLGKSFQQWKQLGYQGASDKQWVTAIDIGYVF